MEIGIGKKRIASNFSEYFHLFYSKLCKMLKKIIESRELRSRLIEQSSRKTTPRLVAISYVNKENCASAWAALVSGEHASPLQNHRNLSRPHHQRKIHKYTEFLGGGRWSRLIRLLTRLIKFSSKKEKVQTFSKFPVPIREQKQRFTGADRKHLGTRFKNCGCIVILKRWNRNFSFYR